LGGATTLHKELKLLLDRNYLPKQLTSKRNFMLEEHSKVAMKAFLSTQKKNLAFLYDKRFLFLIIFIAKTMVLV
jgi:hypothetical protein